MKTVFSLSLLASLVVAVHAQDLEKRSPAAATYIDSGKVAAAFDKGQTLVETPGYKVMASRREKPGPVEIHTYETDVFYILDGTATFVTGGTCADAKVTEPGQLRGTSITGGVTHHLKKGDVIVVPAGLPHQFTEVSSPFLYLTVKPIKVPQPVSP